MYGQGELHFAWKVGMKRLKSMQAVHAGQDVQQLYSRGAVQSAANERLSRCCRCGMRPRQRWRRRSTPPAGSGR